MTDLAVAAFAAPFGDLSEVTPSPRGLCEDALRLWRTRIGLILVVVLVAVAFLGPLFAPHDETEFVGTPNVRHVEGTLLGTDYFGQDVLSGSCMAATPSSCSPPCPPRSRSCSASRSASSPHTAAAASTTS